VRDDRSFLIRREEKTTNGMTLSSRLCNIKLENLPRLLPAAPHFNNNHRQLAGFLLLDSLYLAPDLTHKDITHIHWNPGHARNRKIDPGFTLDKFGNREPAQRTSTETTAAETTAAEATAHRQQSSGKAPHHVPHFTSCPRNTLFACYLTRFLHFHEKLTNSFSASPYYTEWESDDESPYRVQQSDRRFVFPHPVKMPAAATPSGEPDVYMIDEDDNDLPTRAVNEKDSALPAEDVHEDSKVQQVDPQLSDALELPTDDDDDNVTEYSFTSADYVHESELEDSDDDDARSHISLSSTDEPEVPSVHDVVWKDLIPSQRVNYERLVFGTLPQEPLNGSWSFTEDYQAEVDQMCINYNKIYSLKEWLIPAQEAHAVFEGVLDRLRKRAAGIPVFAPRPGVNMGQPMQQPSTFAQHQHHQQHQQQQQHQHYYQQQQQFQNGGMLMGMHPGPMRGTTYMPPQGHPGMPRQLLMNDPNTRGFRNAPPTMITRPPLNGPTPPYPTRERPDFRKTVGKSAGRGGKTRRQAETDEFPWNRQLDFIKAKAEMKTDPTWDYSAYEKTTIENMNATRARNGPVLAQLELGITMKQSKSLHVPPVYLSLLTLYQSNPATAKARTLKRTLKQVQKMTANTKMMLSARLRLRKTARVDCGSKEVERRLAKPAATHTIREALLLLRMQTQPSRLQWACTHPRC
jgi:hypothetical protein